MSSKCSSNGKKENKRALTYPERKKIGTGDSMLQEIMMEKFIALNPLYYMDEEEDSFVNSSNYSEHYFTKCFKLN